MPAAAIEQGNPRLERRISVSLKPVQRSQEDPRAGTAAVPVHCITCLQDWLQDEALFCFQEGGASKSTLPAKRATRRRSCVSQ